MLANAHRQAAEDIEKTILPLQATTYAARIIIEGAWGASFHWIALVARQSTSAIKKVMHVWEPFSAIKVKVQSLSGGIT